jgi:hypothetical protein
MTDFWKYPNEPKAVAELEASTQHKAEALGLSRAFFSEQPIKPTGEIVWTLQSEGALFEVERLITPVLRGAGMRTHRLWRNGQPATGHQWCYTLADAQYWAEWIATRDLKLQLSKLKTRVLELESKLARERFTPQPF